MKFLLGIAFWLLTALPASATDPYTLQIRNPGRDIGIIVGDLLVRTVEIDAQAPYALAPASLPAKGVSRHGVELRDVSIARNDASSRTHYTLQFTYQIFTSASYAKKVRLPQEQLKLSGDGRSIDIAIPAWNFSVSPLATHDETRFDEDMSPYRAPLLLDTSGKQRWLWGCAGLAVLSLIGLLYFNGDRTWLPGMGGPFASSYRKLRRLSNTDIRQGVALIHQAFNQTLGANLFHADLEDFLRSYPRFRAVRSEIEEFFLLSNAVLFGGNAAPRTSLPALRDFCKQCRDCEREPFALQPLVAVTLCSVVLTALVVLLMQNIRILPIWPLVIAWACFFHLGGGEQPRAAMASVMLSTIFGVLMGWFSALAILDNPVAAVLAPGPWAALVIAVFVGIISACAYWKPFSITPVCIYGYAATWGYLDVPGRFDFAVLTSLNLQNVVLILPAAITAGCAFGYLNARLVGMLIIKPQPAP